jgi:hypothetical protein
MRGTPMLAAAFIAAGCSFVLAQTGGGAAGGGASAGAAAGADAGGGAAAGTGGGTGTGASAGTSAGGASAGGATAGDSGVGSDQRIRRSFGVYRRGDDMAPLVIPREEAPVRLRTYRREW